MKSLLILLLISSVCQAQVRHIKATSADTAYINMFNFKNMNEPDLYNDTSNNENYRFIWIRSFHRPIIVRIEKSQSAYTLYWKEWDGAGGYDWGKIVNDKKKTISKDVWDQFIAKLKTAAFSKMKTETAFRGNDGAEWILEGKTPTSYHVVDRWTPMGSEFYKCCDFLIGLTDIEIRKEDKY